MALSILKKEKMLQELSRNLNIAVGADNVPVDTFQGE